MKLGFLTWHEWSNKKIQLTTLPTKYSNIENLYDTFIGTQDTSCSLKKRD